MLERASLNCSVLLAVIPWFAAAVEILSLTLQSLVVISITIVVLLIVYIASAIKINRLPDE